MSAAASARGVNRVWWRLPAPVRRAVLVLHVVVSAALLGELWGLVVLNLTATLTAETELAHSAYRLMEQLIFEGGAPLSLTGLATGVVLALSSPWGLLRNYWVFAKLLLLVGVILGGVLFFTPADLADATRDGAAPAARQWQQVAVVASGVVMLVVATALSVLKPRGRLPWARRTRT
ncbi:MAG TPA: hypothetical protein VF053_03335 [Streptosporangiales bacterium]